MAAGIGDDDLSAYLARLGIEREAPSLDALFRLHRAQIERVPYETTWIHLGEPLDIDRRESLRRVAHEGRGGYCFQLNGALSLVLESLGYAVSLHQGSVHDAAGPTDDAMDNHLALVVHGLPSDEHPAGTWWVDAGLGDVLHEPMPLRPGVHHQGAFDFELRSLGDDVTRVADWQVLHHDRGTFTGMAFRAAPVSMDVFADRHVQLSTDPASYFANTVVVERRDAGGTDIMRGLVLSRVERDATSERTIDARQDWFDAIADVFGLPLATIAGDRAGALWTRVHQRHERWLTERHDG